MTHHPICLARAIARALNVGVTVALLALPAAAQDVGTSAQRRQDYEVVDCLLPPQIRQVGGRVFQSPRRPTQTTITECKVRGGEWVSYDRADLATALKIWMETAQAGDVDAQTTVGEIYERGLGVAPDYVQAAAWYRKAADQGFARAKYNLGTLYEQGLGVERDMLTALNLYREAGGLKGDIGFADAYEQELVKQRSDLQGKVTEREAEVLALQQQVDALAAKLKSAQASNAADSGSSAQLAALQRVVAQLRGELGSSRDKLAALPTAPCGRPPCTREPGAVGQAVPVLASATPREVSGLKLGRYYALIIGNQNYRRIESLRTPVSDAERAATLLKTKYGFSVTVIDDADDVTMLRALNTLSTTLKPDDNLLIYYAGHGARLKSVNQLQAGYWLPVNADPPPVDTLWVPTEQVTGHLSRMAARRVLVVADSCYAGLLSSDPSLLVVKNPSDVSLDYVRYKMPKRARLLISSGGDAPVLDQGGKGNSVFARAFLDVLEANTGVLTAPGLFVQLQQRVKASAAQAGFPQAPELKAIKGAGHEIGDFFFVPLAGR